MEVNYIRSENGVFAEERRQILRLRIMELFILIKPNKILEEIEMKNLTNETALLQNLFDKRSR